MRLSLRMIPPNETALYYKTFDFFISASEWRQGLTYLESIAVPIIAHGNHLSQASDWWPMFGKLFYEESDLAEQFLKRLTGPAIGKDQVDEERWRYFCSSLWPSGLNFTWIKSSLPKTSQMIWIWTKVGSRSGCLRPLVIPTRWLLFGQWICENDEGFRSNKWRKSENHTFLWLKMSFFLQFQSLT